MFASLERVHRGDEAELELDALVLQTLWVVLTHAKAPALVPFPDMLVSNASSDEMQWKSGV